MQAAIPDAATLIAPFDQEIIMDTAVNLQWAEGGGFPTGYKLYFGTSQEPPFIADLGGDTSYEIEELTLDETYYWKIEPYNAGGVQTEVPLWSFSTSSTGASFFDMAAISITGRTTPTINHAAPYTIEVRNLSTEPVSDYTVKLLDQYNNVLASSPGVLLDSHESAEFNLSWAPSAMGDYSLFGYVEMPGDENETNNKTAALSVQIMPEGLSVFQIGNQAFANSGIDVPTPYGVWYQSFRQQYLIRASELLDIGATAGDINSIAFHVENLNTTGNMNNYRIRLKETGLSSLTSAFEAGEYTQACFYDYFMPALGWNVHQLDQPFFWNGTSNIIVDVVTDFSDAQGSNASVTYSNTDFNASLRYQSNIVIAENSLTGTTSGRRSNIRLMIQLHEAGSLGGVVTSGGVPLEGVRITIDNTNHETITAADGSYFFPAIIIGEYTITAHKPGYEELSLPATITLDEHLNLDFQLQAYQMVNVSGTVVGSDNPALGLSDAAIILRGDMDYETTTNHQGQFSLPVFANNSYTWLIIRDGYQIATGELTLGDTAHNMGTIILTELLLPPRRVVAKENDTLDAVNLSWNPPKGSSMTKFDFEYDDGGWIPTAGWDPVGDWEYTDSYDVANFTPREYPYDSVPPPAAYSGTGLWGTKIYTNHSNTYNFSYLSKTFDFSELTNATLRFMSWENVFGNFDFCRVSVNGTVVWGPSWDYEDTMWQERIIDLSDYDGMASVTVTFEFYSNGVMAYAGWYIDDVEIGTAAQFDPAPTRIANADRSRAPLGYKVWRLLEGQESSETLWTPLTTTAITDTTFTDSSWSSANDGIYRWAVKTVYANNATSEVRFSNAVRLRPNDLAALEITGDAAVIANTDGNYSVLIKNTGTAPKAANSYVVRLMHDAVQLASVPGPAIEVDEEIAVGLTWHPTQSGDYQIHGEVHLSSDSDPTNNQTPPMHVSVMQAGLLVVQLGDGTNTNTEIGAPSPYGTYNYTFRQQFLYTSDELYAQDATPGIITALGFDVQSVGDCSAMPNYRIRMKHTTQTALTTTFEAGDYITVFRQDSLMPFDGWNVHQFTEPFTWNGSDNILVDIVVDIFPENYTRNALTRYTTTAFNSSLRFYHNSIPGDQGSTGTVSQNRSNTRFFMITENIGGLSGVVSEDGVPVPGVMINVEDTMYHTETDSEGNYSFLYLPAGTYTVSASKTGYNTVSHAVVISPGETTTQDFIIQGIPIFDLSADTFSFGSVALEESHSQNFTISNIGGGTLTIQAITHSGDDEFALDAPELPIALRTDQSLDFTITFTPETAGTYDATFTITDDQNNRHSISKQRADKSRDAHTLEVSGKGVRTIDIGEGNQNARLPLDFYYKSSVFQTIIPYNELDGLMGVITGIKLYNSFQTAVSNTLVRIWMGSTSLTNLSHDWIPASELSFVHGGYVDFPAGTNTINIDFRNPFTFVDGGNLVILVERPLDDSYYSSSNHFKCQTVGTNRSRNIMSDSMHYDTDNMSYGTISGQFPKMTLSVIPIGVGYIEGVVRDEDGTPMPDVSVNLGLRNTANTDDNGEFYFNNVSPGDYVLTFAHYGYITQEAEITVEDNLTASLDITMQMMPQVSIFGTVIANDTAQGLGGVSLTFTGYADYSVTTASNGEFTIPNVFANKDYEYTITAEDYTEQSGSIEVADVDYNMGVIIMGEPAYAPLQVEAALTDDLTSVSISWNPPDPHAFEITESFEDATFPPTDWSQDITNQGAPNQYGARPTWSRFGVAEGISPADGNYQAGLTWVTQHQDEWLFTPSFTCPADAYLSFETYLQMGSENGDHYYVKVSTDEGDTWTILWDGAQENFALNSYDAPVIINLSDYDGMPIKLAWHADDGAEGFGLYYSWYIDDVYIGNFARGRNANDLARARASASEPNRALVGYEVWRLRSGQEDAENSWTQITDSTIAETEFVDTDWDDLAHGQYLWAVKAIYSLGVASAPVFSNTLYKENTYGTISGFVREIGNNRAISGAVVSAGEYSATTTTSGFYTIALPSGTYTITASHDDYHSVSQEDVVVLPTENTTLNFTMEPTSNADVVEIVATALCANYPNPFNPETTISYDLKEPSLVRLDVFNLKGQLIKTLVHSQQSSGRYNIVFTARDEKGNKLSSGIYFYRLKAGDYTKTRKMMLME